MTEQTIPTIYHVYELNEYNPEAPVVNLWGYYLTKEGMEAKLKYLYHTNTLSYVSYHVVELEFEDVGEGEGLPEYTQQTIH